MDKSFHPQSINDLPDRVEGDIRLSVPEKLRRGKFRGDERRSIESAVRNFKRIASLTERSDWSRLKILDFGCGVKFTQALIQFGVDPQAYVGMDVHAQIIQYLKDNVSRPSFFYFQVPFKNERYNKKGIPMTKNSELPGTIKAYDLITLQSVFTHFNPPDFLALLHVLRRYAASDARLFFTCFIDNTMEHDFIDLVPDKPLLNAVYRESYIREMLEESNWKPISLEPPGFDMAHQFVCEFK